MTVSAFIGFVVGVILDGAIWLWVFAAALGGDSAPGFEPIVRTVSAGDSVTAVGGPGLLLFPLGMAVVGAVVGLFISRKTALHMRGGQRGR